MRGYATERVLGLDLTRAIAVSLVLISHWSGHFAYWFDIHDIGRGWDFLGDIGVDLFFGLSGLLIGRILLDIVFAGPTWRDYGVFMLRRGLRTLPLYFAWLAFLLAVFPPATGAAHTALRFLTLTQNLLAPMPPDYYYAVTWSLTIEEWFYLLFGCALIGLTRWFGARTALIACLTAFIALPLIGRFMAQDDWKGLVPYRIDEIAHGVLLAWALRSDLIPMRLVRPLSCAGACLVGLAASGFLPAEIVPNAAIAGCVLCLPAALCLRTAPEWLAAPVRWVSTRSYALYLIHLTIVYDVCEIRLVEPGVLPPAICAAIAILVPFGLAELSQHLLERPMMRLRPPQIARPEGLASALG